MMMHLTARMLLYLGCLTIIAVSCHSAIAEETTTGQKHAFAPSSILEGSFSNLESIVYAIAPTFTTGSDGDPCGGIPPLPDSLSPDLALLAQEDEQQRSTSSERDSDDGDDGGVHLHGVYRLPTSMMSNKSSSVDEADIYSLTYHDLIINVPSTPASSSDEDGLFRLRVTADAGRGQILDLYLYDMTSTSSSSKSSSSSLPSPVAFSIQQGLGSVGSDPIERSIVYTLKSSHKYMLRFGFGFGQGGSAAVTCQSALLELSLQRAIHIPSFVNRICDRASNVKPPFIRGNIHPWDLGSDSANNNNNDANYAKSYYYGLNVNGDSTTEAPTYWASYKDSKTVITGIDSAEDVGSSDEVSPFEVVAKYPVVLPYLSGRSQRWKFSAELSTRFMIGGDVALVVTTDRPSSSSSSTTTDDNNKNVRPSIDLCEEDQSLTSDDNKKTSSSSSSSSNNKGVYCFYGQRLRKNTLTVETELWGSALGEDAVDGKYTLWIVIRRPSTTYAIAPPRSVFDTICAPYGLTIEMFPMPETENFVSCTIDPLPSTFNVPGMYNDETGEMTFSQDVLVNTSKSYQEVLLTPTRSQSLLRVVVGAHTRVDVDVSLYSRKIASSSSAEGEFIYHVGSYGSYNEDGIVFVLEKTHEYKLRFRTSQGISPNTNVFRGGGGSGSTSSDSSGEVTTITNSNDNLLESFCDSFDLRVFVHPLSANTATPSGCKSGSDAPGFNGVQESFDLNREVTFGGVPTDGTYDFWHALDNSKSTGGLLGKHTVAQWEFTLKPQTAPYLLDFVLLSDPVGGPLTLTLKQLPPSESNTNKGHAHHFRSQKLKSYSGDQLGMGQLLRLPITVTKAALSRYAIIIETPATQRATGNPMDALFPSDTSSVDIASTTKLLPTCIGYNFKMAIVSQEAPKHNGGSSDSEKVRDLPCPGLPFPAAFQPAVLATSGSAPSMNFFGHVSEVFNSPPPNTATNNIHYIHINLGDASSSSMKPAPHYRLHAVVQETTVPMTMYLLRLTTKMVKDGILFESPTALIQNYTVAISSTTGLATSVVGEGGGSGAGGTSVAGAALGAAAEIAVLLDLMNSNTNAENHYILAVSSHYELAKVGLCAQTSFQMSLDPVNFGWKPTCDMTINNNNNGGGSSFSSSKTKEVLPATTYISIPAQSKGFEYGPKILTISDNKNKKTTDDGDEDAEAPSSISEPSGIIKKSFEVQIERESTLRATFEYTFPSVVLDVEVCTCIPDSTTSKKKSSSSSSKPNCGISSSTIASQNVLSFGQIQALHCTSATSYFNGQEVRPMQLTAGRYVINLKLRPTGVNAIYTPSGGHSQNPFRSIACADIFAQFAIVPTSDPYDSLPSTDSTTSSSTPSSSPSSNTQLTSLQKVICPSHKRPLPPTLNDVSLLWKTISLGSGRMHLLMDVLIPRTTATSTFKLSRKSVVRISTFVQEGSIRTPAAAFLMKVGGGKSDNPNGNGRSDSSRPTPYFGYIPNEFASPVAVTLSPGVYILTISRASYFQFALPCESVKLEMSVIPVEDVTKVAAPAIRCTGANSKVNLDRDGVFEDQIIKPLIVEAASSEQCNMNPGASESASTIYFRDPRKTFEKNTTFTLGKQGGMVHFDIRYNFPTEGIRAILLSSSPSTSSSSSSSSTSSWYSGTTNSEVATAYPFTVMFNRIYMHRWLPQGTYRLIITGDGGMERSNAKTSSNNNDDDTESEATCVPLIVDLRVYPYAVSTSPTSAPGSPPTAPTPSPTSSSPDTLNCPWNSYATLPTTLADANNNNKNVNGNNNNAAGGATSSSTTKITFSSDEYSIPYSKGTVSKNNGGSSTVGGAGGGVGSSTVYTAKQVISLPASVPVQGIVIRAWGSTRASGVDIAVDLEEVTEERQGGTQDSGFGAGKLVGAVEKRSLHAASSSSSSSKSNRRIASGDIFSGGLVTMTRWCSSVAPCGSTWQSSSSAFGSTQVRKTLQLVITFTYSRTPKYLVDYTTCDEKRAMESFSFSFDLLPSSTLEEIGRCSASQKSAASTLATSEKSARLLTGTFHLGNALMYSSRDGYLSDDDLVSTTTTTTAPNSHQFTPQQQSSGHALQARTDVWFLKETVIEIPQGSSNISMLFQAQYDSKLMDVYVALRQENNFPGWGGPMLAVTPIATAVGAPSWFGNNKYDATSTLTISPYVTKYNPYLLPGKYFLEMRVHFTDPIWGQGRTEFCAPISSQILIYGDKYASSETAAPSIPPIPTAPPAPGSPPTTPHPTSNAPATPSTPAPDFTKPTIIDYNPSSLNSVDPSETLTITMTLNKPAMKRFLSSSKRTGNSIFAWLEIDMDGKHDEAGSTTATEKSAREGLLVYPDSVYFVDSTHVAAAWWSGKLEWQTKYRLYVDGTTIGRDIDTTQTFDDSAISHLSTSYITGYCSCSRAGKCVGGGGCGCTEANGETCNACDWDHTLSDSKGTVPGTSIFTKFCLRDGQTLDQLVEERYQAVFGKSSSTSSPTPSSPPATSSPGDATKKPATSSPTSQTRPPVGTAGPGPSSNPPSTDGGDNTTGISSFMKVLGFIGVISMFAFGGIYWVQTGMRRVRGSATGGPIAFNSSDATRSAYHQEHHNRDVFTLGDDDDDDVDDDPVSRARLTGDDNDDDDDEAVNPFDAGVRSAVEMKAVKKLSTGVAATASEHNNNAHHHTTSVPIPATSAPGVASLTPSQASVGTAAPKTSGSSGHSTPIVTATAVSSGGGGGAHHHQSTDFFADLDNDDFFASPSPAKSTTTTSSKKE